MRQTGRTCLAATIVLIGLAGVGRGQWPSPWVPLPLVESPVQDWRNYVTGFRDWHRDGFTYLGNGTWEKGAWVPPQRQQPMIWSVPFIPNLDVPTDPVPSLGGREDGYFQDRERAAHPRQSEQEQRELRIPARPRELTPQALAKIEKIISDGDERFRHQRYSVAADRYRAAAQMGSAEAFLRQGFALIAQGNYKSATIAFQNALALKPDWSDASFRLDQIYAPGVLEKITEKLARKLAVSPGQPGLITSMCLQLYFSGDPEKARLYASQATQLGGVHSTLAESFVIGRKKF